MQTTRTLKAPPNDRLLNRLILGMILILAIGVPLIGALYFLDQHVDAGPSMVQRSISLAEEAVRKNPNQVGVRLQLATAYVASGRAADGIAQYTEVLKAAPDNRAALLGRGQALLESGNLAAAAPDFQKVVDAAKGEEMANVDPQLEASYYSLGVIAIRQSRPKDAIDLLQKAIAMNRTDADALSALGSALIQTGDASDAVDVLRRAISLVPSGWTEPYSTLSKAYAALGNQSGVSYANGMVALTEKRLAEAKAALTPLTTGGFAVHALVGLGLVAEQQADTTAAAAYYSRALAIDGQNFGAITGLKRLGVTASASPQASAAASPAAPGSK